MIGNAGANFVPLLRLLDGTTPGVDHEELARGVRGLSVGSRSASARHLGKKACGVSPPVVEYLGSGKTILNAEATRKTSPLLTRC